MPYESENGGYELAKRLGHVPVVENEDVQRELDDLETKDPDQDDLPIDERSINEGELEREGGELEFVLSFDGSGREVPVKEDYPSNRIGYVQIAAVQTDLSGMRSASERRFVDPGEIKEITKDTLQDVVVPSTNFCRKGASTTRESWRQQLYYNIFQDREIEGKPLLEYYKQFVMLSHHGSDEGKVTLQKCPVENDCNYENIEVDLTEPGVCPNCQSTVYPTDRLRLHERVNGDQSNQPAITNLMYLLEHLSMGAYLRYIYENRPEILGRTAFICDGPLAQFDTYAWFHEPLLANIHDVYRGLRQQNISPSPIVSIEKSGRFQTHAKHVQDELDKGDLLALSDEYIFDYIVMSQSEKDYGQDTYYGQKFIYRSNSGRVFVLNVPYPVETDRPRYSPFAYPQMGRTIDLVEEVETALYQDSLIPVSMAHERASIPLETGSRVLELFSREGTPNME